MQPCFSIDQIEDPSCFFLPSVLHHSIDGLYWTCRLCHTINGFYSNPFCLPIEAFYHDDPLVPCTRCHAFAQITFPECDIS